MVIVCNLSRFKRDTVHLSSSIKDRQFISFTLNEPALPLKIIIPAFPKSLAIKNIQSTDNQM